MADGGFRNIYADGPAIRVTDIDKPAPPRPPAKRRVTGERQKIDKFERLLLAVSSGAFWACVAYLEQHVATCPKEGRPREHTIAEWALFWLLSDIAGGLRPSDDVLARLTNWDEARSVVESMGWDHPEMKLSDKAIDRHKYYRFRGHCIGDDQITELGRITSAHAVCDARAIGQFGDSGGSRATVSPEHGVYGDGSQMPPPGSTRGANASTPTQARSPTAATTQTPSLTTTTSGPRTPRAATCDARYATPIGDRPQPAAAATGLRSTRQ